MTFTVAACELAHSNSCGPLPSKSVGHPRPTGYSSFILRCRPIDAYMTYNNRIISEWWAVKDVQGTVWPRTSAGMPRYLIVFFRPSKQMPQCFFKFSHGHSSQFTFQYLSSNHSTENGRSYKAHCYMHHQLLTPYHLLTVGTNPSRPHISSTINPEDWKKKFLSNVTTKLPGCNTTSDTENVNSRGYLRTWNTRLYLE